MGRRASLLLAGVFSAWLCLPLATGLLGLGQSSAGLERRALEPFPALPRDAVALLVYPAALDRYLRDHFGSKRYLAQLLPEIRYSLGLFEGEVQRDVIVGRQRWLFYAGDKSVQKHAGESCITEARLGRLLVRLEAIRRVAPKARLVFAIAPDKQSIYPEYLPAAMRRTGACSDYERVMAAAREHGFDTPDLRPALLAAKAGGGMVYHRNDSHWNDAGALVALQALLAPAGLQLDRGTLPQPQPTIVFGDLTRLLGLPALQEPAAVYAPAPSRRQELAEGDAAFPAYHFDFARPGGAAVLLLGDSFSVGLAGLLGHAGIGSLDWIRLQSGTETRLLARTRPDIVIVEMVERTLAEQ